MSHPPFFLGICGGTGSGKTFLAKGLVNKLGKANAVCLNQDAYYKDLSHLSPNERARVNFDHPKALDAELMISHLQALALGETIRMPVYDFSTHTRVEKREAVTPRRFILVEGILILAVEAVVACLDYILFLDVPSDIRFNRQLKRDMAERGRTSAAVITQYQNQVRPMHDRFVKPWQHRADLVISQGYDIGDVLESVLAAAP